MAKRIILLYIFLVLASPTLVAASTFPNAFNDAGIIASGKNLSTLTFPEILTNGANILISLIAVYALLALVIGGLSYIMSIGDESRAATAKKTIFYAIIGIVVAGSAEIIKNAIVDGTSQPLVDRILSMVNIILVPTGAVAFGALVYGGYLYLTSGGDESRSARAKNVIIYALLGLAVIGIAGIVVNVVIGLL